MPMTSASGPGEHQSLHEACWTDAPAGVVILDCQTGAVIEVNPAAERLTGYARSELLGERLERLHRESERERVGTELLRQTDAPQFHFGFHLLRKCGQPLAVTVQSWRSSAPDGRPVTVCTYFDITCMVENHHLLSTQNWALSAYAGAALALGQATSAESLLTSICAAVTSQSVYALAWIGIAECDEGKNIRIAAAAGSGLAYMDGLRVSWSEELPEGRGPTGACVRTGEVMVMGDAETSEIFAPWREKARKAGIRSSVAIPFAIDAERRGALTVYSIHPHAFEPVAIEVFGHLAGQIGHGIHALEQQKLLKAEQARLEKIQRQLSDALSAMVSPIITAMEMRDPYTSGHQGRVAEIAMAIGREMGWDEERLQGLRVAALVHDIGKISTPTEILTKPGRLTPAERLIIEVHPKTGYAILEGIPFAWPIAEIVRQHHEKLDGSGYPFGLRGEQILPEARVLAVADIVEAMVSDRPYRRAIDLRSVLEDLEKQAGKLLDAEAVRACVKLYRDKRPGAAEDECIDPDASALLPANTGPY